MIRRNGISTPAMIQFFRERSNSGANAKRSQGESGVDTILLIVSRGTLTLCKMVADATK